MHVPGCTLCEADGGRVILCNEQLRVVLVEGSEAEAYPGFCRVIWNDHIKEMSDLNVSERATLMQAVFTVESALRVQLQPEKINLASLGNMTPHLHWHVIPRYRDDATYPQPIWAVPDKLRASRNGPLAAEQAAQLTKAIRDTLSTPQNII